MYVTNAFARVDDRQQTYKKQNEGAKSYMPHLCDESYTRTNIRT